MPKKLQLTIAEPCHENWEGMSPVEKGRFCGSCQKQVVDFSNMSDRQVAEFFKKPSTGSVCGRFMSDQLDRDIEIPKKRIPWVRYFFQITLPAFLLSMKASAGKTQGTIKVATTDTTRKPPSFEQTRTLGMVAWPEKMNMFREDTIINKTKLPDISIKGEIAIKQDTAVTPPTCSQIMGGISYMPEKAIPKKNIDGIILDEQNQPVPFATISTGKNGEIVIADENGEFTIKRNPFVKGNGITVSSVGFENKIIVKGEEDYREGRLWVYLKADNTLPEIIVKSYMSTSGCRYRLGGVSIKGITIARNDTAIKTSMLQEMTTNHLAIFPNPVIAGTSVNLSFQELDEGYYSIQLINLSGQIVHQKEIWIDAEARLYNIEIPQIAKGNYFLVLTNKKTGKKFTEKFIIQ